MNMPRFLTGVAMVAVAAITTASATAQVTVDPKLPKYSQVSGVSGSIKSVGSDSMNNLMTLWAEGFLAKYPNVQVEIEGKGSTTAPVALIAGTAQFGPMSRETKAKENDDFEKKYGYKPTPIATSLDVLSIFVHKDNPIAAKGLTLQQVDAIFSKGRRGGYAKDIKTWGDVGLTGEWADKPISLYGRNSASGTYGFLKDVALFGGDYKDEVKEQPGSSSVVQGIASDKWAIGYSGIGYLTADVKAVPLAVDANSKMVPANAEGAYSGEYPLARPLLVYVNHKPGSSLDPLRREFIKYIFSYEGQQDVLKDGYFPVPAALATDELAKFGIK